MYTADHSIFFHCVCLITGFTPRELAMQCDFYECADLIDELEKMQQKAANARIRESKIKGEAVVSCCALYGWW